MGDELPFEPVGLHLERDIELAASVGVVFGAGIGVGGCGGAHCLEE